MLRCAGCAAALAASLLGALLLIGRHGALAWVFVALGCCRADCSTHHCEEALLRRLCEQHVICLCSRLPPLPPTTTTCHGVELAQREDGRRESSLGVVALFRNEHAMPEWLQHHHDEGATEFVLCDDNSTDPSARESALAFRRTHDVRLVLWKRRQAACGQICVYRRSVKMARSVWLLFVDLDEFAFARSGHGTIRTFLGRLPRAVSAVYLQPHVFGSMGLVDAPESVVGTYLCRGDADRPRGSNSPRNGKTIVRRLAVRTPGPHHPYRADGLCVNADLSCCDFSARYANQADFPLQLNHYQFQAWRAFSRQKLANNGDAARLGFPRKEHGYSKGAFASFDTALSGTADVDLAVKRGHYASAAAALKAAARLAGDDCTWFPASIA